MGRKKKQKPQDEGPMGAPEWVVTFTDMISLLVTFFVLLMTFSSMRDRDLLKVDAWMKGSTSVLQEKDGARVQESLDVDQVTATNIRRGALQPHTRPREELLDNMEDMGRRLTDDHLAVDFAQHLDGLIIEFDRDAAFAPGSAEVNEELAKCLKELGEVLQHYPFMIVLEGSTDSDFRPTSRYKTAEAISFARATAAANVLLRETDLSPEMVQIAGLGTASPRNLADSAEARRENRRVRARVLSLSKTRASHLEALERAAEIKR